MVDSIPWNRLLSMPFRLCRESGRRDSGRSMLLAPAEGVRAAAPAVLQRKLPGHFPWDLTHQNEIRGFLKMGVPRNGWFVMENSIQMDDFWVPLF